MFETEALNKALQAIEALMQERRITKVNMDKLTLEKFSLLCGHTDLNEHIFNSVPTYWGIPVFTDSTIPPNRAKLTYSDGKTTIVKVFKEVEDDKDSEV